MKITAPVYFCKTGLEGITGSITFKDLEPLEDVQYETVTFTEFSEMFPEMAKQETPGYCTPEDTVVLLCTFDNTQFKFCETQPATSLYHSDYTLAKGKIKKDIEDSYEERRPSASSLKLSAGKVKLCHIPSDTTIDRKNIVETIKPLITILHLRYTTGSERWCDVSKITTITLPTTGQPGQIAEVTRHSKKLHKDAVLALYEAVGKGAFVSLQEVVGSYHNVRFFLRTFGITRIERLRFTDMSHKASRGKGRRMKLKDVEVDRLYAATRRDTSGLKRCGSVRYFRCYVSDAGRGIKEFGLEPRSSTDAVNVPVDLTNLLIAERVKVKGSFWPDWEVLSTRRVSCKKPRCFTLSVSLDRRNRAKSARKVVEEE